MMKTTKLPKGSISGVTGGNNHRFIKPTVERCTLEGVDEIRHLYVHPWTSIKMHKHNRHWEVWLNLSAKKAYISMKGEEHELVNNSSSYVAIMQIKGYGDYSYADIAKFFSKCGFSVTYDSLIIND